jgi:hypothetical protein
MLVSAFLCKLGVAVKDAVLRQWMAAVPTHCNLCIRDALHVHRWIEKGHVRDIYAQHRLHVF